MLVYAINATRLLNEDDTINTKQEQCKTQHRYTTRYAGPPSTKVSPQASCSPQPCLFFVCLHDADGELKGNT